MATKRALLCAGVLAVVFCIPASTWARQNATDVEQGKKLFEGMCARCHGFDGTGGEGPLLNRPNLERAADDRGLRDVIQQGIPARGMPRTRQLSDNELRFLMAYVRSLGRAASTPHSGNAANGSAAYNRLGCASCHLISGQGGSLGPELTSIGRLRAPDHLLKALTEPNSALPRGLLTVPGRGFNEYLPVRIVTSDGREVRGIRVNEDSFTIQLRDANNQFHSFRKSDLRQLEKQFGTSSMPSFKDRLSASELDDLIAYLLSLRGAK